MQSTNKNIIRHFILSSLALLVFINHVSAAQFSRTAAGANAAGIQATVDQFRADLGANNGVGGSFTSGRREINWDGVPDNFSSPNFLPVDFFNSNSSRGVVFGSKTTFGDSSAFIVSADLNNPTTTPVRFGDIDPSYSSIFRNFSSERLFTARNSNVTEVNFFIPGTKIPATVSGFGVVFTDVDVNGPTYIKLYGVNGKLIGFQNAPVANNGLSFVGVVFNNGEQIARVEIVSGTQFLASGVADNGANNDIVAMDDFIYGEPRAIGHHTSDFDGDGTSDYAVFRPSIGTWFIFNSGSSTFTQMQFGQKGDIPVDGDFDGDSRSDLNVFRPSTGSWFTLRSSSNEMQAVQLGQKGDEAVAGDYDHDGKTDFAVWRPSSGTFYSLNSSNEQIKEKQFGQKGDIPVNAAPNP